MKLTFHVLTGYWIEAIGDVEARMVSDLGWSPVPPTFAKLLIKSL